MTRRKIILIVEITVFVLLVVLDALGYLPITQTIYILPFIWLSLRLQKEKFSSIGFTTANVNLTKAIVIGAAAGIVLELFATYVTTPWLSAFFGTEPNLEEFQAIKGNAAMLAFFIGLSWLLGAFGEEICFRGFLMNRLARLFGNGNAAWLAALILLSVLFGYGHTEQGVTGWIQEGLSGLFLGMLFLASGKNLVMPIVSHGVSNTLVSSLFTRGSIPAFNNRLSFNPPSLNRVERSEVAFVVATVKCRIYYADYMY